MKKNQKKIDTHCHSGKNWYEPIESLIFQMDYNNVSKAIIIQHGGYFNHEYLFEASSKYLNRLHIVAQLDPNDEKPLETLEKLKSSGACGIRLSPNTKFSKINSKKIWNTAGELGLPVSVHSDLSGLISENFQEIISTNSKTKLILEHYAGLGTTLMGRGKSKELKHKKEPLTGNPFTNAGKIKNHFENFQKILKYSKHKNIFVKIHGLGEIESKKKELNDSFDLKDSNNIVKLLVENFGSKRLMWGSDFPPVSGREGYSNSLKSITENKSLSENDLINILWNSPKEVFNL